MRLLNLISGSNIWHKILENRLRMKRVHVGDACSKDKVNNKYSLSETGTTYEYGGLTMATVKEVKLMEDEVMVTPVVLIDSVKTPDGRSFKESVYPNAEIDAKISKLQNSIKEIASKITVPKRWAALDQNIFTSVLDICYRNGKFVAVGGGGKIAYSTDGINWTEVDSPFGSSSIYSVCYGNGKFVAGGTDGKMAYSPDGINWTAVADSPFTSKTRIESICYGNEKFIAGGWYETSINMNEYVPQGRMAYSTDGVTWTSIDSSLFKGYYIYSICYGKGKFVAGGGRPSMTITQTHPGNIPPTITTIDARAQMAYSTDGITWTEVDSTFGGSRIYSIYQGDGKFVAGGTDGKMAYSPDGINWTAVTKSTFGSSSILSTYYGNGNFLAGGVSGKIAYSSDGITWTAVADSAFGSSNIPSFCYGNGKYIAGGTDGKMAYSQVEFDFGF